MFKIFWVSVVLLIDDSVCSWAVFVLVVWLFWLGVVIMGFGVVLLIDDFVGSGSTLNEIASKLKSEWIYRILLKMEFLSKRSV